MSPRALVAEPSASVSSALRRYLEAGRFEVRQAATFDEALATFRAFTPDVVFTSATRALDGEALCESTKALSPSCPVVVVYAPEEADPEGRAAGAGADGCLVGPLKRGTVVSTARAMLRIREMRLTVDRLEAELQKRQGEGTADFANAEPGSVDLEFFRKYLMLEMRRSRRYRYPVALLTVSVDNLTERLGGGDEGLRQTVLGEVLVLLTRAVRDIDLVVPFAENRYLVFLPNTSRDGALAVASRMQARVGQVTSLAGLTGSVGVAAIEPAATGAQVNVAGLLKESAEALKRAQGAGGNRVEAPRPTSRRDRIVLG